MPFLTIEQIKDAPDIKELEVEVPEWGGSVKLRGITVGQRSHVVAKSTVNGVIDTALMNAHLLVAGMIEPQLKEEHVSLLMGKGVTVVQRLITVIMDLSGMNREAAHNAEAAFPRPA